MAAVESKIVRILGDQRLVARQQAATGELIVISADAAAAALLTIIDAVLDAIEITLNAIETSNATPTAVLNGQVVVAVAAAPLAGAATPVKSVTIENLSTNAVVFVGDNAVTIATGYGLRPGATVSMDIDDLNKVYVIGTAGNVVTYIAVN